MCCRSEIHVKRIFQLGINFDLTTFVWHPSFVILGLQSLGWDIGLGQLESRSWGSRLAKAPQNLAGCIAATGFYKIE